MSREITKTNDIRPGFPNNDPGVDWKRYYTFGGVPTSELSAKGIEMLYIIYKYIIDHY